MRVNAKLECTEALAGQPLNLGLLVEVAAPQLPEQVQTRTPQAVVFVIDRSGSMGGGRLDLVKQSIGELVGRLAPTDHLAVVSFDNLVEVHIPMQLVTNLTPTDIRRKLADLTPRGGTNIELGYRHALAEAAKAPNGTETKLVLLSDGQANQGVKDPALLAQLAAQATEHLVSTATIGIGTGYNEQLMAALSESGHGNHFAAVNVDDALAGLQDEIDGLLARSLVDVEVSISGDNIGLRGVNPVGFVRGGQRGSGALGISEDACFKMGEIASGEERGYAFVVDFGEVPDDEDFSTIWVKVRVSAKNASDGAPVQFEQRLAISVQSLENFSDPVRDEDVVAEIAAYRLQEAKLAAARLAEAGRIQEAREMLTNVRGANAAMLDEFETMNPRVRARLQAEDEEMERLLGVEPAAFAKLATESRHRGLRAKSDPRKK